MYMYAIYSIKLIFIDTFVKQIKIQLELLKCSNQVRQKILLCVLKCHCIRQPVSVLRHNALLFQRYLSNKSSISVSLKNLKLEWCRTNGQTNDWNNKQTSGQKKKEQMNVKFWLVSIHGFFNFFYFEWIVSFWIISHNTNSCFIIL